MKTKPLKTENKENPMFAFLPEMVLVHLNEAKPTQIIVEDLKKPEIQKITIVADPEIPNLDYIPISETVLKKEEIKVIETETKTNSETPNNEPQENIIKRFISKIKIY